MALVPCRHSVTGHTVDLPEDVLPAWRAVGWLPMAEEAGEAENTTGSPPATPAAKSARTRTTPATDTTTEEQSHG